MSDEPLSYTETLHYTQGLRRQIINKKIEKGIPEDDDSINVLLKAMKDMDQTAIQDRRNNIEEDNSNNAREVAASMKEFLTMQRNENPFMRTETGEVVEHALPKLNQERLGSFQLVEGEQEIGILQESADAFIERMKEAGDRDED